MHTETDRDPESIRERKGPREMNRHRDQAKTTLRQREREMERLKGKKSNENKETGLER